MCVCEPDCTVEISITYVFSVCVYGGGSRRKQIDVVTKGVEIVVATPGRLNDLIRSEFIDVTSVSYLMYVMSVPYGMYVTSVLYLM